MRGVIIDNTYRKSEKEKSKLRIGTSNVNPEGSWTILMKVIDNPKVKKIVYKTEKKKYKIDKENTGTWDQVLGNEYKRVVPINKWQVSAI